MLAVVLFVVVGSIIGVALTAQTGRLEWLFIAMPFSLMLWVLARLAPTGYVLASDGLHIERRFGPKVIPYRTIQSVDRAPRPLGGLTFLGSKGIFGRFGHFWSPRLGLYRLYVTDGDEMVWLVTDDGLVGLSPDRPDEFVERLSRRLPHRPSSPR